MKKRIFMLMLLPLLLLSACSKNSSALQNLSELELAADQTLVTGQVVSRVGNDIELAAGTLSQRQGGMGAMPSDGTVPSGDGSAPSFDPESMPSDGGTRPSFDPESLPSGGPGNGGSFPDRQSGSSDASGQVVGGGSQDISQETAQDGTTDSAADGTTSSQIRLTGETMNLTIPVGTRVLVTSNGTLTVSSFGRIQTDDILQLILMTQSDGTQTVTQVQILE